MNDQNDERLKLRWGVKADGVLIAAFALKDRAADFAARGRRGTPPPLCDRIEVVFLGPDECPACRQRFKEGEFVTIVPLGPGDDPEERAKAREGRVYNAVAAVLHYGCATGKDPPPRGGREPLGGAAQ